MWSLILFLALVWFLIYWVVGGVFFACVALLRLIRLRKARFSCLFTLTAMIIAFVSSWLGTMWTNKTLAVCLNGLGRGREVVVKIFFCGFWQFIGSMVGGLLVLILLGFILLKFSSWRDRSWLTNFTNRLEWKDNDSENNEN